METNYDLLIRKMDEFIRKYYKNQLIRGLLYTLAVLGSYFLVIVLLEYFSWFNTGIRSILFYTFLIAALVIIARFIVLPAARIARLGTIINHEQAAVIIGKHFAEVKDTLLNTLQLKQLADGNPEETDLIRSGIDQKIARLNPVPFKDAVDFKANRKYLRFALPPLLFLLAGLLIAPSLIVAPTKRILFHSQVFERPAPFTLQIINSNMEAVQQADFTVRILIKGDEIPDQFYLESGTARYRMEKLSNVSYRYTFRNLQQTTSFFISADHYYSREYTIKVIPKPIILSFDVISEFPAYLGRKSENSSNTGDITVPEGTRLTWKIYTRDTRNLYFRVGNKMTLLSAPVSNTFTHTAVVMAATNYSIRTGNQFVLNPDSLSYFINVVPDLFPSISVNEYRDSVYTNRLFFQGEIRDDYGFSKLTFNYSVNRNEGEPGQGETKQVEIPFDKTLLQQPFSYFLDVSGLQLKPGDGMEYFFEVRDNDGVHGPKVSRSGKFIYKVPTLDEIETENDKNSSDLRDKLESVIKQSQSLQRKVDDIQRRLVDKKEVGWQEKQTLQQLLEKQQQLQQQIQEIDKENKQNNLKTNQYSELPQELLDKQKQLEELFNKVMNEDMKKMYDELQHLLENVDKDKMTEMLDKIRNDSKGIEREIDRNLELFKQLELEQKLEQAIAKINKLSEDQLKLSKAAAESSRKELDKLNAEQQGLRRAFDKVKDDLDEVQKKNAELERPNSLQNTDQDEQAIARDMDEGQQQLNEGKSAKASQAQKSAADKLKKLSEKLTRMQQDMQNEAAGEDIEAIRQILDNLVKISMDQESCMNQAGITSTGNPKYVQLIQLQKNLRDDLVTVSDSLYALSKRQAGIEPFILREMSAVENNMDEAIVQLNYRATAQAMSKQQYAMTSVNNLALMLSEALKSMQQNMQNSGSGNAKTKSKNPGSSAGKMKSMRQLQEQLNSQLQKLREGMSKPNKDGSAEQRRISEQLARMAAQQELLRRQLQSYGQEMQQQGSGVDNAIKEALKKMEQTETEIVNKQISAETLKRQQEIVTRMLESEKAEQQRENDNKRQSEEGKDIFDNNTAKFQEYNKIRQKQSEFLLTVPPGLKPFYKSKVNAYFLSFDNITPAP